MYSIKRQILEYCYSSDNRTWNMTGFFKNECIDIPSIEEQNAIASKINDVSELLEYTNRIKQLISQFCQHHQNY